MYRVVRPARRATVEQAQTPVGITFAVLKITPHEAIASRATIGAERRCRQAGENALLQTLTYALIGVDTQDPVVRRLLDGELLHQSEAAPFGFDHTRAVAPGNLDRRIFAGGVDDHDFAAERHTGETLCQLACGVPGDQDGGKRRRTGHRLPKYLNGKACEYPVAAYQ